MTFDVGIKFSVETQELINARNALHSLAQAAKELNNNQDKAAQAADRLKTATEDVTSAADKAEKAAGKTSRSAKDMAGETDAAAAKLQKLNDQLGYLRNDLNLSETGFTKSQAGVLAWAKSVGASESIIKDFAGAFDKFNKAMGEQSLDKSVNGLSMLNRQLREFEQLQQLAKDEVTLTSTQVKMLARDMEILKQQNEAFNRESSYGVVELKNNFIEAAKQVNNYVQQAKEAERAEKERAAVVAAAAKANMDVMDQAVTKFRETEAEKTRILEANRKRVNDSLMQQWSGGIGGKSPELEQMANFYKEEERAANENKARLDSIRESANSQMMRDWATQLSNKSSTLSKMADFYKEEERLALENANRLEAARKQVNNAMMQQWAGSVGQKSPELTNLASQYAEEEKQAMLRKAEATKAAAAADKIAADAIAYLERESSKLVATNDLLSRGFTQASANALYRYKEALQAAGVSANELKQRLYTLEQDLITKQQMSPFTKMREDMGKMQQDVKHLARAISVQLGDVFVSLASGQNLFTVMIQQGDQIRGALQQAKDANQDLSKAMQGAFSSMASSFKLVGVAIKDFVADGFNTVAGSMQTVIGRGKELDGINKMLAEGSITPLRAQRLEYVAVANAMNTLRIAALGMAAAVGGVLLLVLVELSKEQDRLAQSLAKTGGYFGATSQEAIALSKSLMDVGVRSGTASKVIEEMAKAGNLGKESFAGIAVAANDAQKYVGIGVDETVKKFSELIKDPIKVLNEFAAQTGMLSQEQIGAVQSMLDLGDAAGAQEAAIKLLQQGYASMTTEAVSGMSSLGIAMADLKSSTSEMWDEFKNSDGAAAGLTAIAFILKSIVSMASAAVFLAKAMTVSFALGKDISVFDSFEQMEAKRKAALDTIAGYEKDHNDFLKRLWGEQAKGVEQLTAAQREQNSTAGAAAQIQSKLNDVLSEGAKANAKEMSKLDFVDAKRMEAIAKATKGFSAEAKQAFMNSEEGFKISIALTKQYGEEWEKAHKKVEKVNKGSKPKETYKVDRSNELAETKRFYDEQLKQIKDSESKQEASLKQSYDAKLISLGEYYAKQTELSLTSQQEQLAVINESSDKQKAAIQSRMLDHVAAFEKEVKAGGNVVALTDKLEAELANLTRTYGGVTQATDTQTQALQTATDKKFYEFYKELNKNLNESKNALEKFSETVVNNAANRQDDLDLQRKLLGTYGAEAEALKASTAATRSYSAEIKKQTDLLKKQDELIAGLRKGRDGLTDKAARDKVDQEILQRLEERAAIEKNLGETTALAKQDAEQAAIDAVASYNIKVFQEVRDAISSDLYDAIFEGGSKGANALKNVLKNAFKNFVINAYINPIVGNVVGSVMGAIGMGGGLSGATGGGGGFSLGGGSLDIGQSLIDYGYKLAGTSTFMGDAVSSLGTSIKGLETTIKGIPGFEGGYGSVLGYGSALLSLSEGKYGSALGTGIGTYLMPTLGPLAPMIGSMLGGFLNDAFGGGSPNLGGGYLLNKLTGKAYRQTGGPEVISAEADKMATDLMESTIKSINSLFEKLGSQAKVEDFWGGFAADEKAADSAWAGGTITGGIKFGQQWSKAIETELGSVEEAVKQYQVELSKATLDALKQATDIPEYIQTKLKDVDVQALSGEGVTALIQEISNLFAAVEGVNATFELLGVTLDSTSAKSGEYQLALVESAGGLESFTNKVNSYYQNFYSESERYSAAIQDIANSFSEVGLTLPKTREEYRALVEAQDLTTEAGRNNFNTLIENAEAFNTLSSASDAYYSSFYSETEKQQQAYDKLTKAFADQNLQLPESMESYRALVEAQDLSTESGRKNYAVLMANAGAFAALAPTAANAGKQFIGMNKVLAGLGSDVKITAAKFDKSTTEMFESLGLSAEEYSNSIANVLQGIMTGKISAEQAGTELANAAVGGITSAIAASASQMIAAEFTNSIIAPVVANIMAGKAALDGIDMAATAASIATQAGAVATALAALGPTLAEALNGIISSVSSVAIPSAGSGSSGGGGSPFSAGPGTPRYGEIPTVKEWVEATYGFSKSVTEANARVTELLSEMLKDNEVAKSPWEELADRRNHLFSKELQGYKDARDYAQKKAEELSKGIGVLSKEDFAKTFGDLYMSPEDINGAYSDYLNRIQQEISVHKRDYNWNIKAITELEGKIREWTVAQTRLLATEEYVALAKETQAAIDKTEELKLTGGLEDPVTKLKQQFAEKMKNFNDNIKKVLMDEVELKRANLEKLDPDFAKKYEDWINGIIPQDFASFKDAGEEYSKILGYDVFAPATLNMIKNRIEQLKKVIPGLEGEITALTEEQQKYIKNIEDWYKAQAELLSTEMLIDINNQIKQLETEEKGPLTTIKDAIRKYIDDFTELGTMTDEIQAALDKLSALQLDKAREELYNQLIPEDELKQIQTAKLSNQFQELGVELPSSADALRKMIDAARETGNIDLADSLLQLIPSFLALQEAADAADGAGSSIENITQSFIDAYKSQLGRAPDTEGLKYWINLVESGTMTMEEAMAAFSESATTEKLNNRILELTDSEAYLALMRQNELSLLSPINQELQEQIYLLEDQAKALAFANEIAKTKTDADIRLLRAQGNTTEADRLEREQFIKGLTGLTEAQKQAKIEAYDYGKAIDAQIKNIQILKEVSDQKLNADIRLLQAQGNTTEADRLQREQFIAGLEGLTEAQKQAKIEAYDYGKAIDSQIKILQERQGLESKLNQLLGDTDLLRKLELEKLDPSNRALQERIWAIEDEAKALAFANEIAKTKTDADIRLLQAQGNTAEAERLQREQFIAGLTELTEVQKQAKIEAYDYGKAIEAQIRNIQILKEVSDEKLNADISLLQAQGKVSEVENIQREQFIAGLEGLTEAQKQAKIEAYDYTKAIEAQIRNTQILKEVSDEKLNADISLLQAQGNIAEVERLQRAQFVDGLEGLTEAQKQAKIEAYDYTKAVDKQIAIIQERTGLESSLYQLLGNTAILRERELAALDPSNRALQERIWAIEDADNAVSAALDAVGRAVEAEKKRIDDAANTQIEAIRKSMEGNEKTIETAQKQVDLLSEIFDNITNAVKTLRGSVDKEQKMLNARAYIDTALVLAKSGVIPDKDKLAEAIDIVTNDETLGYSTLEDFKRAQYIQANKLEELGSILGVQKTTEEKQLDELNAANKLAEDQIAAIENQRKQQLEALDLQLQKAKEQVDVMRGIDISIKSVSDAINSLSSAISNYQKITSTPTTPGNPPIPSPSTREVISRFNSGSSATRVLSSDGKSVILDVGSSWSQDKVIAQIQSNLASFSRDPDKSKYEDLLKYAKDKGIPGFAVGTNYVPQDMLANIHEGEMIVPKRFNPSTSGLQQDNSELVDELKALRAEVSMLRAEARATAVNTSKTARILDDVTQGGDTLKTEVAV